MSNFIPMVSSSPPPLEDGGGFNDWDDDDDEFGNFTGASNGTDFSGFTDQSAIPDQWNNIPDSPPDSDFGKFANFANFPTDTNIDNFSTNGEVISESENITLHTKTNENIKEENDSNKVSNLTLPLNKGQDNLICDNKETTALQNDVEGLNDQQQTKLCKSQSDNLDSISSMSFGDSGLCSTDISPVSQSENNLEPDDKSQDSDLDDFGDFCSDSSTGKDALVIETDQQGPCEKVTESKEKNYESALDSSKYMCSDKYIDSVKGNEESREQKCVNDCDQVTDKSNISCNDTLHENGSEGVHELSSNELENNGHSSLSISLSDTCADHSKENKETNMVLHNQQQTSVDLDDISGDPDHQQQTSVDHTCGDPDQGETSLDMENIKNIIVDDKVEIEPEGCSENELHCEHSGADMQNKILPNSNHSLMSTVTSADTDQVKETFQESKDSQAEPEEIKNRHELTDSTEENRLGNSLELDGRTEQENNTQSTENCDISIKHSQDSVDSVNNLNGCDNDHDHVSSQKNEVQILKTEVVENCGDEDQKTNIFPDFKSPESDNIADFSSFQSLDKTEQELDDINSSYDDMLEESPAVDVITEKRDGDSDVDNLDDFADFSAGQNENEQVSKPHSPCDQITDSFPRQSPVVDNEAKDVEDEKFDDFGDFHSTVEADTLQNSESTQHSDNGDNTDLDPNSVKHTVTGDEDVDDDFDSFADFHSSAVPTDTIVGTSAALAVGGETSDFASFPTASAAEDGCEWATFQTSATPDEAGAGKNDDDDDFGEFEDFAPANEVNSFEDSTGGWASFQKPAVVQPRGKPSSDDVIKSCFPGSDGADEVATLSDGVPKLLDSCIQGEIAVDKERKTAPKIWQTLKLRENAVQLSKFWSESHGNSKLFTSLHIDTRNILLGHRKSSVPMYASNLTLLEPTKGPKPPSEGKTNTKKLVDTSKTDEKPTNQDLPPVQFDWTTSGLTNPLEANSKSLELDFLVVKESETVVKIGVFDSELMHGRDPKAAMQPLQNILANLKTSSTIKKARPIENLTPEADKVIGSLPNLSFMQAKVLMFPFKESVDVS